MSGPKWSKSIFGGEIEGKYEYDNFSLDQTFLSYNFRHIHSPLLSIPTYITICKIFNRTFPFQSGQTSKGRLGSPGSRRMDSPSTC